MPSVTTQRIARLEHIRDEIELLSGLHVLGVVLVEDDDSLTLATLGWPLDPPEVLQEMMDTSVWNAPKSL